MFVCFFLFSLLGDDNKNEFPRPFVFVWFFFTMGCSFIISIHLYIIFYNHSFRSNNRGLRILS